MSTPPPPPGYGTLPPDPYEPQPSPYPSGQTPGQPYPGAPGPAGPQYGQQPNLHGTSPAPYGSTPSPYGSTPSPYGAPPQRTSTAMTPGYVSLGMGIFAIPAGCCCWFLGWIPALAALGTGAFGLSEIKSDPSAAAAKPFLIAGIALGGIGLFLTVVTAVWGVASFFAGV
ncbi:hypothetical protein LP422_22745 [Janibacter limosus]|uniref:DUF4190 domain-containing protein n=1 Tax=Janibacter limosus TaxID=53458 RepID=UPI0035DE61C4|nr:hypothetical protein LP422_22745 [Janibacter limosus]